MLDKEIIAGFVEAFLRSNYEKATKIADFHKELWELCTLRAPKVAIAAPRGHSKSTSVTFAYGLASLLFRERRHLLIISDTQEQATAFLGLMRTELTFNEKIKQVFGIKGLVVDNAAELIVEFTDGKKFRAIAKGSGQKLRGLLWDHSRPDLIIGDDLENEELVYNNDRRTKFREWWLGSVEPAVSDDGIIRVVGTILHLDSLLERWMPENQIPADEDKKQYLVVEPCKTYNTYPDPDWVSVRYRAHNEDFSHILWEERWPEEKLKRYRQSYAKQGFPEGYSQEYLNYPIDDSTAYFQADDFLPIKDYEEELNYYVGGDFAISQSTKADYTAFGVIGVNSQGRLKVSDVKRGRWDAYEIVETILRLQEKYHPVLFIFEKGQIWLSIEPILLRRMQETGLYISYDTSTPVNDKQTRARPLQARMRAGAVEFNKEASWYPELEQEMLRFPKDIHDDQVDSLATICLKLQFLAETPTDEERWEEDYQEALEASGSMFSGKSYWTGY